MTAGGGNDGNPKTNQRNPDTRLLVGGSHGRAMKVALIIEWLDGWRGGAETSTLQFMNHLLAAGVELHVYTRSRPSPTPQLHVHTISGAAMSRIRRSVTFAHRAASAVRHERHDIVHAISPCFVADVYEPRGGTVAETRLRNLALLRFALARGLKRLGNPFNIKQQHQLAVERQLLMGERGPIVVALSRYVVDQLQRHYRTPMSRIRLIRNGVDPDLSTEAERAADRRRIREELSVPEGHLLVLSIAHNFRLKGVQRWLEALALLRRRGIRDVHAAILGKGESARWHRLAQRLGVASQVTFTGPTDRVRLFQHAGDALVHPTYYDPCSRVVLEALSAGLPVVTSRYDGAAELLTEGVDGFVLDEPADIEALADRVERLRDPLVRRRIAESARYLVPVADMKAHAEAMLGLYEELLKSRDFPASAPRQLPASAPAMTP